MTFLPGYGLGLAERRYGSFLHDKKRSEYVISSKVGKLLKASRTAKKHELFPFSPSPNDVIFDYTSSGVRRSIEDSLQRLGIDSSRNFSLNRVTDFCAIRRFGSRCIVKLKPRNFRSHGRATALFYWFTLSLSFVVMNRVMLVITRSPARRLRTYTLQSSAYRANPARLRSLGGNAGV
jgi:hypothetical protein